MLDSKNQAGFTLAEAIVAISILAILASFAAPNWNSFVDRSRQQAIIENLHSLFAYARWTAASNRTLITVCPLSDQNVCLDQWNKPISVFIDSDNDKRPPASGEILRRFDLELSSFNLRSRTGGRGYFQFDTKGMSPGSMGSLLLCPREPKLGTMSYMPINIAGRFRVEFDRDADGIIRLPWGGIVSC